MLALKEGKAELFSLVMRMISHGVIDPARLAGLLGNVEC